jgi:ketosteroid isomerase-like protein
MEPGRPTLVGKEAILAWLQAQFDRYTFDGSAVIDEVIVLAPDWIVWRNHGEFTATPKVGGEVIPLKETWLGLLQRQPDGSWKYRWAIGSSDTQVPWK